MVVSCGDANPEPYKVWARTHDPVILSLNIRPQNVVNFVVSLFHNRGCTDSNPRMGREREEQPRRSWAMPKVLHFQRLIDRFNCLCNKGLAKRVRQNVVHQAILSSSMAEHSAVIRPPPAPVRLQLQQPPGTTVLARRICLVQFEQRSGDNFVVRIGLDCDRGFSFLLTVHTVHFSRNSVISGGKYGNKRRNGQ
jgi:hypothetical protein